MKNLTATLLGMGLILWLVSLIGRMVLTADSIQREAAAQASENIVRAKHWTGTLSTLQDALGVFVTALTVIAGAALALGLLALLIGFAVAMMDKHAARRQALLLPVNGSFALQKYELTHWLARLRGQPSMQLLVNPNNMVGNAGVVTPAGFFEQAPAPGWEVQLQARKWVQSTHTMQALPPGRGPNVATFKALNGHYDKALPAPRLIGETPTPAQTLAPLSLKNAVLSATPDRWVVGQNEQTGKLAVFNPQSAVHAAVLGTTGTGKTASTGFTLAAQALTSGHHLTILDPKGWADWGVWSNHAECLETDTGNFSDQLRAVFNEHVRRANLCADAKVSTVLGLPSPPPPWTVIIEEYGDLSRQMKTGTPKQKEDLDSVNNFLDSLISRSRQSDIHLVLIDQYPEHWSPQTKSIKYQIVYKLGPNQGAAVQEYKAYDLPDHGRFMVRNEVYNSWFAANHITSLLAHTPPSPHRPMLVDSTATPVTAPAQPLKPWVVSPPVDDPKRWQSVVDQWFAQHPEALVGEAKGITDLARAMAQAEGNVRPYADLKSTAFTLYHEFRSAVRVGGERLGIDTTHAG